MAVKSCRAVAGDSPLSLFNSSTASSPLEAAGIHNHPEDLDMVLRLDSLSLDCKGLSICLVLLAGEVDDCSLVHLESCSASSFPL